MAQGDEPKKPARARATVKRSGPAADARPKVAAAQARSEGGGKKPKPRARRTEAPGVTVAVEPNPAPAPITEALEAEPIDLVGAGVEIEDAVLVEAALEAVVVDPPSDVASAADEAFETEAGLESPVIPRAAALPEEALRFADLVGPPHGEDQDDDDDDDDDDDEETNEPSFALRVEGGLPPAAVPGGRAAYVARASMMAPAPDDESGSVLITGICGRLGKLLVRELHRDTRVIGIDRRAFPDVPKDVVHHRFDVRRKKTKDVFRSGRVRAVVHLGVMHDPRSSHRVRHSWNVVAFQKILEYMAQYGVRKLVVLSSANAYGPQPDNPQFLTEEAPLLGSQEFYAIRDLVELDMLAQGNFWKNPDVETVILRPCHILGEVRNAPSNYLRLENPLTILGFDPMIQVIHERDVVRAITLALRPGIRGIFNLRGPGELPLSKLLAMAGRTPRPIAAPLARLALSQLFRLRLASFPAPEIDHIRYLCMVDDARAREVLGFVPTHTLQEAVAAALSAA